MSERRKNKKKKDIDPKDLDKKPTKEEYAIAQYLKQKLPEKKTTLLGHKVEYFIANKAIDCLMESSWAKNSKKGEIHFNNRDAAVSYMERMLGYKLFHRAKKIIVQKEIKKKKKDEEDVESGKEKESKKSKGKSDTSDKKEEKEGKKESEAAEKKKEKKKIKLDMHLEQIFVDSNEPYVWIYDPISIKTWITGTLMVVAAVLICLFPLWPQCIRHYIYYLSVAAAFFLVFIIGLAIFRLIFFVLVWVVTLGKHHIWLLPNLTEDVGFFESFWPLYKYEYKGKVKDSDDKDAESKDDQAHKNDDESKKEEEEEESREKEAEKSDGSSTDQDRRTDQNQTESEESGDEKQKGGDNENGFEIIEAEDANESKSEEEEEEDRKTK